MVVIVKAVPWHRFGGGEETASMPIATNIRDLLFAGRGRGISRTCVFGSVAGRPLDDS
jgi:hypothetical protein